MAGLLTQLSDVYAIVVCEHLLSQDGVSDLHNKDEQMINRALYK